MTAPEKALEALLLEKRRSSPPKAFAKRAHVRSSSVYRKADRDYRKFWAGFARELDWYKPWKKVLDWKPPKVQWFVGGKLNVSVNCLDRHLAGPAQEQGGADLGRGAGRQADVYLPRAPPPRSDGSLTCSRTLASAAATGLRSTSP